MFNFRKEQVKKEAYSDLNSSIMSFEILWV